MNNIEQSIKDRLKNIARQSDKDYNFVAIQYMQERFLARLEESDYRDSFILKGALLLLAYDIPTARPSKDIDFLGEQTSSDIEQIRYAVNAIADNKLNDGVTFEAGELAIEQITEDAEYTGFRIKIWATVGGDRHRLQLDIGFGDKIVNGPVMMDYPSMLDFPSPNINVYSLESAIAEKLEAIVSLGTLSSRMKDYFDVWHITQHQNINENRLQAAIDTTFTKRNTPVSDVQYVFNTEYKTDKAKQQQWQAFLNRSNIELQHSFKETVNDIEVYMEPILSSL